MELFEGLVQLTLFHKFWFTQTFMIVLLGSSESLQKRHLRVVVGNIPPFDFVKIYPNGSFTPRGCSKNTADWLALKLNFTIAYVHPTVEEVKEGGIEALVNMVASGRADMLANGIAIAPERFAKVAAATYPQWEEGYRMAVPRPDNEDRLFAFIKPFDETVWVLTGVSFLAVSLLMSLLSWLNARYDNTGNQIKKYNKLSVYYGKYFLYNINVLTSHGDYLSESKMSFLIGTGCWLLGASILVYGYSSLVVSAITLSKQLPSADSLEDVLAHPEVSLIIRTDTYIGKLINTSTDIPLYNAIREKALKRPESVGNEGIINSTKLLLTGKYAYPFIETIVKFAVATQFMNEKKCRLKVSKRLRISNGLFYSSFQRGDKQIIREISLGTMELWETGLIEHWLKTLTWIPQADVCFAPAVAKKTTTQSSIKLMDLASAFFILGVGGALSILAFLYELVHLCRVEKKKVQKIRCSLAH